MRSIVDDAEVALLSWMDRAMTDLTDLEQYELSDLLEVYVLARIAQALEEHIRNG